MERCTTDIAIFQNKQRISCYKQGYISESMLQTWQYISKRLVVANTKSLLYFRTSDVTPTTNRSIFQKGTLPHVLQTWLYISKRLVMANTTDIAIFHNKQRGSCYKQIHILQDEPDPTCYKHGYMFESNQLV